MEQVNFIRTQAEPITVKYTIRIDRDIEDPSLFQEELATIRQSNEGDIIHILINSGGGRLDTAKAFLNSMAQSPAHIITEIEGEACSAATLIFLAGDEYRVTDDATMMVHTSTYGYVAKENNVRQYVEHQAKATDRLIKKYYRHFLSEDETTEVLNGKDLWMDADEIMERLEKRQELFTAEMEQEQEEQLEEQMKEIMGEPIPEELLTGLSKEQLIKIIRGELTEDEEEELFSPLEIDTSSDSDGELFEEDIFNACDEDYVNNLTSIEAMKSTADMLRVKYPHNIGVEKLRQKILNHLDSHHQE